MRNLAGQTAAVGLIEQRQIIDRRLKAGAPGADVVAALTDFVDGPGGGGGLRAQAIPPISSLHGG